MGHAKIRREAARRKMLQQLDLWEFPSSPWEAVVCADLREDDVVLVRRVSRAELARIGVQENECHTNARLFVASDPTKKAKVVTGWWVNWPNFILHSVVEIDGVLICITPSIYGEEEFPFIPDPQISWVEDGQHYSAVRNNGVVGIGVRAFPAFTIAQSAIVRERLLSGGDPLTASNFSDDELTDLKRKYILQG